jgi:hypothetical protein
MSARQNGSSNDCTGCVGQLYIYILEQVHLLATKMDTLGVRVEPFRCSF